MNTCQTCSADISNRVKSARFCFTCIEQRRKSKISPVPFSVSMKRLKIDGVHVCLECKKPMPVSNGSGNTQLRCHDCAVEVNRKKRDVMASAHAAVRYAIARGELKPIQELACVDCGAPATCYDHRDYSKPLEVDPVCQACNLCRGPGANREAA
jgi:hypothetical protein